MLQYRYLYLYMYTIMSQYRYLDKISDLYNQKNIYHICTSAKTQRIAFKIYIALYSSKLIHRSRCRKRQSGPVLRVVRHTRSVKKRPPREQIPFSTLSSPLSHPRAMQGFPSLSLASLTLEKRTAGKSVTMNTATNERILRM